MPNTFTTDPSFVDVDLPDEVLEAEAVVAEMAENYTIWVRDDIATARSALTKAKENLADNAESIREIFSVCHDIKGQGSSFGFDLMTMLGASLCDLLREGGSVTERKLAVVEAHVDALAFVIDRKIKGDGGDKGRQLVDKLQKFADKVA